MFGIKKLAVLWCVVFLVVGKNFCAEIQPENVSPVRTFALSADVEKAQSLSTEWGFELVPSPFFIQIQSLDYKKPVGQLKDATPGSFEHFLYALWKSLIAKDRAFLQQNSVSANEEAFRIRTEMEFRNKSMNDHLLRRFDIGRFRIVHQKRQSDNREWVDVIEKNEESYKWHPTADLSDLSYLLVHAARLADKVNARYAVEIPAGDRLPESEKAYLRFDAQPVRHTVSFPLSEQDQAALPPKVRLVYTLMQALHDKNLDLLKTTVAAGSYRLFLEMIQMALTSGYEIYLRPLLEKKEFLFEIENDKVSYLFYRTGAMRDNEEYKIFTFRKIGREWKITNFHSELFLEQLLLDPVVQKQIMKATASQ